MRRGQSAVIDAFFFLMVCASAATLMIYTAGVYGANTTSQMAMIYNFEYASNSLIALHYAQDDSGGYFWKGLERELAAGTVENYLKETGDGGDVWSSLIKSSPSAKTVLLFQNSVGGSLYCFEETNVECIDGTAFAAKNYPKNVYTSSVTLTEDDGDPLTTDDSWLVVLQLYY